MQVYAGTCRPLHLHSGESDRKEFLRRKYSSNRMWAYLRAGNCRCKEKTAYCTAADVCTRLTDATQGNLIKHMGIGNF